MKYANGDRVSKSTPTCSMKNEFYTPMGNSAPKMMDSSVTKDSKTLLESMPNSGGPGVNKSVLSNSDAMYF